MKGEDDGFERHSVSPLDQSKERTLGFTLRPFGDTLFEFSAKRHYVGPKVLRFLVRP